MPRIEQKRWEEILAACMLLGEPCPILCSLCLGAGHTRAIVGVRRCVQCEGKGFDYIGPETSRYVGIEQPEIARRLDCAVAHAPDTRFAENIIESYLISWQQDNHYMSSWTIANRVMTWFMIWALCAAFGALAWSVING